MKRHWYDHLWVVSLTYLILGFFNILFAWLGLFCFFIPLIISAVKGTKGYCNRYCGRGPVRLWILQRDADLHCSWPDHHGAVQTPQLVCVLPYGDHDPAGLQGAEQQSVMSSRNGRYSLGKI